MTDQEKADRLIAIFRRFTGVDDPAAADFAWAAVTHPEALMDALVEGDVIHEESDVPLYMGGPPKTWGLAQP